MGGWGISIAVNTNICPPQRIGTILMPVTLSLEVSNRVLNHLNRLSYMTFLQRAGHEVMGVVWCR